MRTVGNDTRNLAEIEPLPEHFDYMEAVQFDEYYDKGCKITLRVGDFESGTQSDQKLEANWWLNRQILKTDSCEFSIPEIDMQIPEGKAKFGTLYTFFEEIVDNLQRSSAGGGFAMYQVMTFLEEVMRGSRTCTVILDDPLGNSAVQVIPPNKKKEGSTTQLTYADDPNIQAKFYNRTVYHNKYYDLPEVGEVLTGEEGYKKLIELLHKSSKIVVLTGAGVSTESGVPAYRNDHLGQGNKETKEEAESSAASTTQEQPAQQQLAAPLWKTYDPKIISTLDSFLRSEEARAGHWHKSKDLIGYIASAQPNPAHMFVTKLQENGKLLRLITQNIDGMHQRAGTKDVIELHGTTHKAVCLSCNKEYSDINEVLKMFDENPTQGVRCTECKEGLLKTKCIFFGEKLDAEVSKEAQKVTEKADLLVVMGTALLVQPANQLVPLAVSNQIPVVILNFGTTDYDDYAQVILRDLIGELCNKMIQELKL